LLYNTEEDLLGNVGRHEKAIIEATEDMLDAICTSIIHVGFGIEYEWLSRYNTPNTTFTPSSASLSGQSTAWKQELEELVAWLGWASDEVRCEELCAKDEFCYIPMWPLNMFGGGRRRRRGPIHYPPDDGRYPRPPKDDNPPEYGHPPGDDRPPGDGPPPGDGHPPGNEHLPGYEPPSDWYGSRPPRRGPPPGMGDSERDLWTPKCIKISG